MKISVRVRYADPTKLGDLLRAAEDVGLHGLWVSEPWGYDAGAVLGWCAANSRRVLLGTHIVSIFARSPASTAGMAASLWTLSGGRFRLGLGTSGPGVVEAWSGVRFVKPVARTRDTVNVIRQVLSGQMVSYRGETLTLPLAGSGRRPLRFAQLAEPIPVPIYLGALGPRNQALTAELADGWTPTPYSPDHHALFAAPLSTAIAESGRDVKIAPVVPIAIGDDLPAMFALERRWSAFYLGAMGDFYAKAVARMGFGRMVADVRQRWSTGDRGGAGSALEDEYLDSIGLFGSVERVAQRLRRYEAAGVDEVVLELRKRDHRDQLDDLRTMAKVLSA
ncbi:LLM class flavin-dependent oxidoreductase [[Mycobacterium] wendilense]|uniref:LLM class flavin-dependent oxidoreductase n=1 Tax=[Mycobacterium] wendilense TaxID=3064284 RepID=A0ABN9P7V3_9MYCO|nr:LLM class flavin-dependent oxidoreductase [Mycolicibacterium sp. MU0050]CAJ1586021.1 LLM class flavin-dependent oxidoreductase [Mycolicibacterium sp. MU0050]